MILFSNIFPAAMGNIKPLGVGEKGLKTEFGAKVNRPAFVFGVGIPIAVYCHNSVADGGFWPGFYGRFWLFFAHFLLP